MSTIKAEIEHYMTEVTKGGRALTSRFAFPEAFIGFQGHFPEKKILPGVCQIQCALSTFEKGNGAAVALKEVLLAKYFSPVFPGEEVLCSVSHAENGAEGIILKAAFTKGASRVAELKLRVSLSDRENR